MGDKQKKVRRDREERRREEKRIKMYPSLEGVVGPGDDLAGVLAANGSQLRSFPQTCHELMGAT